MSREKEILLFPRRSVSPNGVVIVVTKKDAASLRRGRRFPILRSGEAVGYVRPRSLRLGRRGLFGMVKWMRGQPGCALENLR